MQTRSQFLAVSYLGSRVTERFLLCFQLQNLQALGTLFLIIIACYKTTGDTKGVWRVMEMVENGKPEL